MENVMPDQHERTELSWGKCAKGKGLNSGTDSGVGRTEDEAIEKTEERVDRPDEESVCSTPGIKSHC